MTPEVFIITAALGITGTVGTAAGGAAWWAAKRLFAKVERVDVLIRGDGNGNPGINERIRDVHTEVKEVRVDLKAHAANPGAHD